MLFPKDVIYVLPLMGTRRFCWKGQAGAAGSLGRAALPAVVFTGDPRGRALPGDQLRICLLHS